MFFCGVFKTGVTEDVCCSFMNIIILKSERIFFLFLSQQVIPSAWLGINMPNKMNLLHCENFQKTLTLLRNL